MFIRVSNIYVILRLYKYDIQLCDSQAVSEDLFILILYDPLPLNFILQFMNKNALHFKLSKSVLLSAINLHISFTNNTLFPPKKMIDKFMDQSEES